MRHVLWTALILVTGCATSSGTTPPAVAATAPHPAARPAAPAVTPAPRAVDPEWQRLRALLPATPRRPVVDSYFGVQVTDPYRWLEAGAAPAVQTWMKRQDQIARDYLGALPGEKALARRFREILAAKLVSWGAPHEGGGRIFALKREPPKQQPFLVVLPSVDATANARVVVDPNVLDPSGHTAIDWYHPSPDGKLVAVSLSKKGTESGDLHVFDVATGRERYEVIPHVQGGTAGGDAVWTHDGKGLLYTRYPRAGERPTADLDFYLQVWFHRLGTPVAKDRYEIGKDFPRIAEIKLLPDHARGRLLAIVQDGDSGRFQHYLRARGGRWTQLTTYADRVTGAEFAPDGTLYLLSLKDAPKGRFLRLPRTARTIARAQLVVPEQDGAAQWDFAWGDSFLVTRDRLYVTYQMGGPTGLKVFALPSGTPVPGPAVPPVSTVGGLRALGRQVAFRQTSYVDPSTWYLYDPATKRTRATALRTETPVRYEHAVVERHFAVSKDGTKIPFVMVMRQGTPKDGNNPVLATAYGGYGFSLSPHFSPTDVVWLEHGGIFVVAGVRGGGEYGETWHRQGSGLHKQNTFDDFAAVLQWLVAHRYSRPARIGIIGGSNGGILMGAMITQHPKLQRAVVSSVGVYDMLRNERTPNGQFNVPEYGSVTKEAQFRALYAYSPYHHVVPGTPYPAVLLTAGANDPRVDPMHSRKLAAALQHASTSGRPILLRVDYSAGHGLDTNLENRIETVTHVFAFLMKEVGMLAR
jgi:prolyl oligopeptidase